MHARVDVVADRLAPGSKIPPRQEDRRRWDGVSIRLLLSLFLWLAVLLFYQSVQPRFGPCTVQFFGQPRQEAKFPYEQKKVPKGRFVLIEDLGIGPLLPTAFAFYPQDILWKILVNGDDIRAEGLPLSALSHEGRSIDLAPYLHEGNNRLELDMEVVGKDASLRMYASPWDKYLIVLLMLLSLATFVTGALLCSFFNTSLVAAEAFVLMGGVVLRFVYVLGTPYFVRAYDYWGHAAYLDYVAAHLSLPDPHANWEAFQPPLYYFVVGALTKALFLCGLTEDQRYTFWQCISVIGGAGVLIAGFRISRLLFPADIKSRLNLLAVLGVAPALVLNTSRASNDILIVLLEFVWLGLVLQHWKRPAVRTWLGLSAIVGLALLTKASALVLVPISLLCLVIKPDLEWKPKMQAAIVLLLAVAGIAGWYYLPRAFHESSVNTYVVGNLSTLNPKAHIDSVFLKSLVFNPFKVIRYPFAEPWGPHSQYFLEVFFKTIFTGEWMRGASYRWLGRIFIIAALLLVPVFLLGLYDALKRRDTYALPLAITFAGVFAAQWNFVQIAPYLSSQDFRYSVILLVPMTYFFLRGVARLPVKWGDGYLLILQFTMLNCAVYVLELALQA
jgi:hypothetical protein